MPAVFFRLPALPAPLAALAESQRPLTLALGISLLFHAILLAVHFAPPDFMDKATERALDVVLVNSKSRQRPHKAQAKAQANLDGGGDTAEDRRAKTPLPPSSREKQGNDLIATQRRVTQLETEAQQMMVQMQSARTVARTKTLPKPATPTPPVPEVSGMDLAARALAIARLEGEIARQMEEYNQRPRKKFLGTRVEEYRFAQYVEDWRQKIERVGNLNYPPAASGRLYGDLVLTVAIKSSGELDRVEISRPSGHRILDLAAMRIVRLSAPFAPFPEAIRRDTDIIEITRTWKFTSEDGLHAN